MHFLAKYTSHSSRRDDRVFDAPTWSEAVKIALDLVDEEAFPGHRLIVVETVVVVEPSHPLFNTIGD